MLRHLRPYLTVTLVACALVIVPARIARADSLALGVVSFDVLVPGDGVAPGVNVITLLNLTGDPASGGFALDPDFPSYTPVTFMDALLIIVVDGTPQVLPLGDVGPGPFALTPALMFPDTALLSSLTLSATLSTTTMLRSDATPFMAADSLLLFTMLPVAGDAFVPGIDLGVISVAAATTDPGPVSEPGALALLTTALVGLGSRVRGGRANRP